MSRETVGKSPCAEDLRSRLSKRRSRGSREKHHWMLPHRECPLTGSRQDRGRWPDPCLRLTAPPNFERCLLWQCSFQTSRGTVSSDLSDPTRAIWRRTFFRLQAAPSFPHHHG